MFRFFCEVGVIDWLDFMPLIQVQNYYGIDPRKENHPIYREQAQYYEKHRSMF